MKLSEHFTLEEFTASPKAVALNIPNNPNGTQVDALSALCFNVLEPIRAHFKTPIHILSGFRCERLNQSVGGAPTSQHTKGEAADITLPSIKNCDVWQYIVDSLNFDQVIAEKLVEDDGNKGWVHVSYHVPGNRKDAISFIGNGQYVKGLVFV